MRSGWITTGSKVAEFEAAIAKYCKSKNALCLNSGTAALQCGLILLGIGEGDEVITTPYTYSATFAAIAHTGAKPVLVDLEPTGTSFEMSIEKIADAITPETKAIMPVDFAGCMGNYPELFELVENKRDIFQPRVAQHEEMGRIAILADAAHSFGACQERNGAFTPSGAVADLTAFSFHAVKNLTTAEGGALTSRPGFFKDEDSMFELAKTIALHGQSKSAFSKFGRSDDTNQWEYDVLTLGYKWNMTDIAAAIGLVQLSRYPEMLARREQLLTNYEKGFEDEIRAGKIGFLKHYTDVMKSSGHLCITALPNCSEEGRNLIIRKLGALGISTNVHFKPLPMFSAYRRLGYMIENFPAAYNLYRMEMTLPLHTKLTDEDQERVIEAVRSLIY
jgi:dTDP-4-amino-4,6-dideoxygalactose transaminase